MSATLRSRHQTPREMGAGIKPSLVPGERNGCLTVIEYAGRGNWLCQCDCGAITTKRTTRVKQRPSCADCAQGGRPMLHGQSGNGRTGRRPSLTYRSWKAMHSRCNNPNNALNWRYYGGRGITVCDRWQVFENFLADMGERPKGRTLDRINNEGNYEPGNCRWATPAEQAANRR